jgi:hypothetical protein
MTTPPFAIGARQARPATASAVHRAEGAEHAPGSRRMGPVARLIDRVTRRWMVDLYDMDLQLDAADIDADLRHGWR